MNSQYDWGAMTPTGKWLDRRPYGRYASRPDRSEISPSGDEPEVISGKFDIGRVEGLGYPFTDEGTARHDQVVEALRASVAPYADLGLAAWAVRLLHRWIRPSRAIRSHAGVVNRLRRLISRQGWAFATVGEDRDMMSCKAIMCGLGRRDYITYCGGLQRVTAHSPEAFAYLRSVLKTLPPFNPE